VFVSLFSQVVQHAIPTQNSGEPNLLTDPNGAKLREV
jgi:hypothetical protein